MISTRTTLAILAMTLFASRADAQGKQRSGIWIHNETTSCAWVTVYTAGNQVREGGFPNWVLPKDSTVYPVSWQGVGQSFDVRVEFKQAISPKKCPGNDNTPVQGDIRKSMQGSLAYQVKVRGSAAQGFTMIRY